MSLRHLYLDLKDLGIYPDISLVFIIPKISSPGVRRCKYYGLNIHYDEERNVIILYEDKFNMWEKFINGVMTNVRMC